MQLFHRQLAVIPYIQKHFFQGNFLKVFYLHLDSGEIECQNSNQSGKIFKTKIHC